MGAAASRTQIIISGSRSMKTKSLWGWTQPLLCLALIVSVQAQLPNGPGSAVRLDGVDDYVQIPHAPALTVTNRFTVEFA